MPKLRADYRRAEATMLAHGITRDVLPELILPGLASAAFYLVRSPIVLICKLLRSSWGQRRASSITDATRRAVRPCASLRERYRKQIGRSH
jgi:hypothetical protein